MAPMQGWIPACSPTASGPLSVQKAASSEPTPGLSPHPIFPRSTSIYSLCGRELGPAGKDTSCWSCSSTCSTCRVVRPHLVPFPSSTTSRGASFLASTPRSPTVAPSWIVYRLFQWASRIAFFKPSQAFAVYPGPQGRGHYWCPRGTSVPGRPSMGCPCTRPRLGGSRGRRPPDHHTWTAKVDNSLTRPVTTSALPRRRVTCAGITGYLSVRVSGSFWA